MSIRKTNRIHSRDDRSLLRPLQSGRARRLGIPKARGLPGLWTLPVHHPASEKAIAYIWYPDS